MRTSYFCLSLVHITNASKIYASLTNEIEPDSPPILRDPVSNKQRSGGRVDDTHPSQRSLPQHVLIPGIGM